MVLNSKFFGVPQNRERVFIIGSLRGERKPEILPFGEINEINNIQTGGGEKWLKQSNQSIGYVENVEKITTTLKKQNHVVVPQSQIIKGTDGVSSTINAHGGGQGAKTGLYIMDLYNNKIHSERSPTLTEPHHNTLRVMKINSATQKGYSEATYGDGIRLEYPESKTARGRVIKQNSNTLKSGTEGVITTDMKIRRLTPLECERLQGFPEGWTEGVSDTQRYKQMGNAVTVNVIEAIARKLI
jgi:DNA (cytosine-5)-methyltransferase 1